jgi:hypothetical protein
MEEWRQHAHRRLVAPGGRRGEQVAALGSGDAAGSGRRALVRRCGSSGVPSICDRADSVNAFRHQPAPCYPHHHANRSRRGSVRKFRETRICRSSICSLMHEWRLNLRERIWSPSELQADCRFSEHEAD